MLDMTEQDRTGSTDSTDSTDSTVRFWDRISKSYEARPIADIEIYEKKLAITRDYLTPETSLLEVGCGTGKTAVLHAPFVKSIIGTDFSAQMIEIARRQAELSNLSNIEFEVAGAMPSLSSRQTDVVMAMSLVHLLEDPKAFMEQVHKTLSPGGVFISSTECLSDVAKFLKPVANLGRRLKLLPRLSFFSCDDLVNMMQESGFSIEHEWRPKKGSSFIVARAQ